MLEGDVLQDDDWVLGRILFEERLKEGNIALSNSSGLSPQYEYSTQQEFVSHMSIYTYMDIDRSYIFYSLHFSRSQ